MRRRTLQAHVMRQERNKVQHFTPQMGLKLV
jgi:hypothetical protein